MKKILGMFVIALALLSCSEHNERPYRPYLEPLKGRYKRNKFLTDADEYFYFSEYSKEIIGEMIIYTFVTTEGVTMEFVYTVSPNATFIIKNN